MAGAAYIISDQFRAGWNPKEKNAENRLKTLYQNLYKSLASPNLVLDLDTFECVEGNLPETASKVLLLWARYSGENKEDG